MAGDSDAELFQLAVERAKGFGSREEAQRQMAVVPAKHRRLVLDAINSAYPPSEALTPEAAKREAFQLQMPKQDLERSIETGKSLLAQTGALQTAATALGGAFGGPLGAIGAAGGSEAIAQKLGITEPSINQVLISMGLTAAPYGLSVARQLGPRKMAESLNVIGEQAAKRHVATLRPAESATALFKAATSQNIEINAVNTLKAASDVVDELAGADVSTKVLGPAKRLLKKLEESGGSLTPSELQQRLSQWGELAGSLEGPPGGKPLPGYGAAKKVLASLNQTLESSADEIGGALSYAREVYRKTRVVDRLENALDKASQIKRGTGGMTQFDPQKVIKSLKAEPFYEKAFSVAERTELEGLLKKINEIPVIPPGGRQPIGSGRFWEQVGIRGAMAGGTLAAGGGAFTAAGVAGIPTAHRVFKDIALAFSFPEGRTFLKNLLTSYRGKMTPRAAQILSAYVASQFATSPEIEQGGIQ